MTPLPRVAFVIDELEMAGTQRQLLAMATGLTARGWTVRIVCLQPSLAMAPEFAAAGLEVSLIEKRARLDLRLVGALYQFLRRERIEIVHAFSSTAEFFASLAARARGCGFVASFRNSREDLPLPQALAKRLACRLADVVVANSEAGGRHAVGTGVVPPAKLRVVPNGLARDRLSTRPRDDVRRELGVPPDACLIVTVGRLVPQKGYDVAVAIAAEVAAACPSMRLLIVGDGPMRADIERWIDQRGLGHAVRLLGERHDVPHVLGAADVYLSASRWEGQSNAVMEAMAAGLPVVASAVGGTPELVHDGVTGLLFDPHDVTTGARHLVRVIGDERLRRELGTRARDCMATEYGVDTMLGAMAALYQRIAAGAA